MYLTTSWSRLGMWISALTLNFGPGNQSVLPSTISLQLVGSRIPQMRIMIPKSFFQDHLVYEFTAVLKKEYEDLFPGYLILQQISWHVNLEQIYKICWSQSPKDSLHQ